MHLKNSSLHYATTFSRALKKKPWLDPEWCEYSRSLYTLYIYRHVHTHFGGQVLKPKKRAPIAKKKFWQSWSISSNTLTMLSSTCVSSGSIRPLAYIFVMDKDELLYSNNSTSVLIGWWVVMPATIALLAGLIRIRIALWCHFQNERYWSPSTAKSSGAQTKARGPAPHLARPSEQYQRGRMIYFFSLATQILD